MSNYSDFWLPDYDDWDLSDNILDVDDDSENDEQLYDFQSERTRRLIKLSAARRAIANYVNILTGKSIPVIFNDSSVNCTDGKHVYLSSDITKKDNFDVAVGLALHEGSHIKYSDMKLFETVWMKVPRVIYDYAEKLNVSKETVGKACKDILNYVEDRYIDYTVHKNAPGYRGYYDALYDAYFNSSTITTALTSQLYRTSSIESYMFRIINFTNPKTDLYALPGLYDIAKILELSNISRLNTPESRMEVAYQIAELVFKNITDPTVVPVKSMAMPSTSDNDDGDGDGNGKNSKDNNDGSDKNSDKSTDTTGTSTNTANQSIDDILGGSTTSVAVADDQDHTTDIGSDDKLSKTKLDKIQKAFSKQKDFLSGNTKKKKVSKKEKELLDVLEKSKVEILDVAQEFNKAAGVIGGIECIIVKNMTRELLMSEECPMCVLKSSDPWEVAISSKSVQGNTNCINEGIIMGTKIGRLLQVRNEINIYKFSRRSVGKLDKRLIHELGFSDENIFFTTLAEKYKKINMHISVDASSSMSGTKWNRAMKLCVALAKAASMLDNVNLTISFRTTNNRHPYVLIAYDSKVDKFSKIRNLFPYLRPTNVTPEGLCYEALLKYLPTYSDDTHSYFINLCDGEPCFTYTVNKCNVDYRGEPAAKHTNAQVRKIREAGYNVLAYYIEEYVSEPSRNLFKIMYGADSSFINVENITQIASTLNKKMMEALDI